MDENKDLELENAVDEAANVEEEAVDTTEVTDTEDVIDSNDEDKDPAKMISEGYYLLHKPSKWLMTKGDILFYGFLVALVVVVFIVSKFIIGFYSVEGDSMKNTFKDGDTGICLKWHADTALKHNDIVIFWADELDEFIIKRCVAVPGESIEMHEGVLKVNGEVVEENYIREPMEPDEGEIEPTVLGDDEFFAMGDNRNESCDCRDLGPAKLSKIDGIVLTNFGKTGVTKKKLFYIIGAVFLVLLILSFIEDALQKKKLGQIPKELRDLEFDYVENEDGTFTVGLKDKDTDELHEPKVVKNTKEAKAYASKYAKGFYHYLAK